MIFAKHHQQRNQCNNDFYCYEHTKTRNPVKPDAHNNLLMHSSAPWELQF